jgi:hypothetical protein
MKPFSEVFLTGEGAYKVCTACRTPKPVSDFWVMPESSTGYRARCKQCQPKLTQRSIRNNNLKKNYGISLSEYDALYAAQAGKCAICRHSFSKLMVDHNHATGIVRGLLCARCNTFLGYLETNQHLLEEANQYVTRT